MPCSPRATSRRQCSNRRGRRRSRRDCNTSSVLRAAAESAGPSGRSRRVPRILDRRPRTRHRRHPCPAMARRRVRPRRGRPAAAARSSSLGRGAWPRPRNCLRRAATSTPPPPLPSSSQGAGGGRAIRTYDRAPPLQARRPCNRLSSSRGASARVQAHKEPHGDALLPTSRRAAAADAFTEHPCADATRGGRDPF